MTKQQDFINKYASYAQDCQRKTGVLASLTMAQAILESGWGESGLTKSANNFFGIKGSYNGQSVTVRTAEYTASREKYYINAAFRKYPTPLESFADHADLFIRLDRYKPVMTACRNLDYRDACIQVRKCGYATDPKYGEMLIGLIESYGLNKFDKIQNTTNNSKPTTSNSVVIPSVNLKRGDKGEAVMQLQKALCHFNFYPDKNAPDKGCVGEFGPKTENAVSRFQSIYVNEITGTFGPKTRAAMQKLLK